MSEEEEEEKPSLPTPRKRLMNFKINRSGQCSDQSLSSVVARRLFSEGRWWQLVLYRVLYHTKTYYCLSLHSFGPHFTRKGLVIIEHFLGSAESAVLILNKSMKYTS